MKQIIPWIAFILFIFLIIITLQVIDGFSFVIDFKTKADIISSYAGLLGAILSFLAILFVLYTILDEKEKINNEKVEVEKSIKLNYLDRLKLLYNYLDSTIKDIQNTGDSLKEFFEKEKSNPIKQNQLYFTVNKNFNRIAEMDTLTNFKAFQTFYSNEDNWEKYFLDLYMSTDFYMDKKNELKEKYHVYIKEKYKKKIEIKNKIQELEKLQIEICNHIKKHSHYGNIQTLYSKYVYICDDFLNPYHHYVKLCNENNTPTDLDEIYLLIKENIERFKNKGVLIDFDNEITYQFAQQLDYLITSMISISSSILQLINFMKSKSIFYGENIEKEYNEYYKPNNNFIEKIKNIQNKIETILKENHNLIQN